VSVYEHGIDPDVVVRDSFTWDGYEMFGDHRELGTLVPPSSDDPLLTLVAWPSVEVAADAMAAKEGDYLESVGQL
jgi:hypothetical protein